MFDNAKGWIAFTNLDLPEDIKSRNILGSWKIVDNGIHKFKNDLIAKSTDDGFYWFDGYIYNKEELIEKNQTKTWEEAFVRASGDENFLKDFRGGFCGFISKKDKAAVYSDHVGNRSVYYYCENGIIVFSSRFNFIVELLRYNDIHLTLDTQAVNYMMSQGYMMDCNTFAKEISRVLPGEIVWIENNKQIVKAQYYLLNNKNINKTISEDEAVELIDRYFRQAVKRAFDKDIEYGYKHLVSMSGGLDCRMTSWVAHAMGYTDQTNITFSRREYLDFKIAQNIALFLNHTWFFMPMDDFKWYKDIDEIVEKNNGAALYVGPSGGPRMVSRLNNNCFGILHSGQLGDVVLGTYIANEKEHYSRPQKAMKPYTKKIICKVPKDVLRKYDNVGQFTFYTRGLIGTTSSEMIFQNYVETASPFLDVDFLEAVLTLPFSMRKEHYIYMKWIEKKYPQAAEFGWEKWGGICPKLKNKKLAELYGKYLIRYDKILEKCNRISRRSMNPFDYWFFDKKKEVYEWTNGMFEKYKNALKDDARLSAQAEYLFREGSAIEKAMVLTALKMADYVQY